MVADAVGTQSAFSDDVLREILYSNHVKRHAAGIFQHLAASKGNAYLKVMLAETLTPDEAADVVQIAKIFTTANTMKKSGFYTDFQSDNESWASPSGTTATDFEAIFQVASEFVDTTLEQVRNLLGEDDRSATEEHATGRAQPADS